MSRIKLFTHTDLDGVGCAILAYLAFGQENVDVEYCNYDDVDEKVRDFLRFQELGDCPDYDTIYITDISIKEETVKEIMGGFPDCDTIYITDISIKEETVKEAMGGLPEDATINWRLFDHHATALYLNKYCWCEVSPVDPYTNTKTSGTEMFFFSLNQYRYFDKLSVDSIKNLGSFVRIVREYDTWQWKELGDEGIICKQVNDLFYIYGREEFIEWAMDEITKPFIPIGNVDPIFPYFYDSDKALLEQKQKDIDRYIEKKNEQLTMMKDPFGYTYGVVFAEQYFSELGNRLCELHPELDYVAMIDISSGTVSYRCTRDDIDLGGEIAHSFGGGGHKKAAGSVFDGWDVRDLIIREVLG